jgi:hypothetical protein
LHGPGHGGSAEGLRASMSSRPAEGFAQSPPAGAMLVCRRVRGPCHSELSRCRLESMAFVAPARSVLEQAREGLERNIADARSRVVEAQAGSNTAVPNCEATPGRRIRTAGKTRSRTDRVRLAQQAERIAHRRAQLAAGWRSQAETQREALAGERACYAGRVGGV